MRDTALAQEEEEVTQHGCSDASLEPLMIHIGALNNVQGIAYDPFSDRVQWIDGNTFSSAQLDGTKRANLLTYSDQISLRSVVYDWLTGQFMWTGEYGDQIDIARYSGLAQQGYTGVLLSGNHQLTPTAVAMDIARRYVLVVITFQSNFLLFVCRYLYFGDSYRFELKRIYMGAPGFSPVTVLSGHKLYIIQMSYEPRYNRLYWYNGYSDCIEVYTIDTSHLTCLVPGVTNVTHVNGK